jgi:hypothetical protein
LVGSQFEFQFTYVNNATAANAPADCSTSNPRVAFSYLPPPGITNFTILNSVGTLELPLPPVWWGMLLVDVSRERERKLTRTRAGDGQNSTIDRSTGFSGNVYVMDAVDYDSGSIGKVRTRSSSPSNKDLFIQPPPPQNNVACSSHR